MKIALTICEYNPLHNGHLYALKKIKERLGPDAVAVIMSGNFTERGEIAVMHKYKRAAHAVKAGADIVFELPTVFATAPAEIFAKGAVRLLSSLNGDKTLCFGTESGDRKSLIKTAEALAEESPEFKALLKEELKAGNSHAKARSLALEKLNLPGVDLNFTKSPNNILALEYTEAIIQSGANMDVMPILRTGAGHNDLTGNGNILSAKGIRRLLCDEKYKKTKNYLPKYVYKDLPSVLPCCDDLILYSLISADKKDLRDITDCTEGLENRIKAMLRDNYDCESLITALATRRYTTTRLSRIMLSCMLGISGGFTDKCLSHNLYLKVLAVKKDRLDILPLIKGNLPFIMRKSDADALSFTAKDCFMTDVKANDIYNLVTKERTNEYMTIIV